MNPFIELFRDPVGVLSAVGYGLGLVALLILTLGFAWSNVHTARAQFKANWHAWDYYPPLGWILRVAAIPGILAVDAWVLSTIIWLLS